MQPISLSRPTSYFVPLPPSLLYAAHMYVSQGENPAELKGMPHRTCISHIDERVTYSPQATIGPELMPRNAQPLTRLPERRPYPRAPQKRDDSRGRPPPFLCAHPAAAMLEVIYVTRHGVSKFLISSGRVCGCIVLCFRSGVHDRAGARVSTTYEFAARI